MQIYGCKCLFKKEEISQVNNLTFHLKSLDKEEQTKHKYSTKKKISLGRISKVMNQDFFRD